MLSRVSVEKQGHAPQHISVGADMEDGRGRGLVQLLHAHSFHRAASGQNHWLKGAVDSTAV